MNCNRDELKNVNLIIKDGFIEAVVPCTPTQLEQEPQYDEVHDMSGYLVMPGLVNTHHHFFQTLTRVVPGAQNSGLFDWLKTLYPIWNQLTPECIFVSTQIALAELALSGCTTAADHLYVYPNGIQLDDEIHGAHEVGLRIHASRGSMSLGESKGGLPPDDIVENEKFILDDSIRLIEKYHNSSPGSMVHIVIAPCSPFSISYELMQESRDLARHYGTHLHTHLAETKDEENYCLSKFAVRPVEMMKQLDWIGNDVWFAHTVFVNKKEIDLFSRTGCGVAHCPTSNMRLSSGIAPIKAMLNKGINVGLGVDGSASNDSSHMLNEVKNAMLLSRLESALDFSIINGVPQENPLMTARQALEMATIGGASVLGRKDIGSLETGKCADFIAINLSKIQFAGAMHDPVSAVVFCGPLDIDATVVGGNFIVKDSQLQTINLESLIKNHNKLSKRLMS